MHVVYRDLKVINAFMVEIEPRKQKFLAETFRAPVFNDASDMDQDSAPTSTGAYLKVPKARGRKTVPAETHDFEE